MAARKYSVEDVIDEIYNDDDSRDEDYSPSDEESDVEDEDSSNNDQDSDQNMEHDGITQLSDGFSSDGYSTQITTQSLAFV